MHPRIQVFQPLPDIDSQVRNLGEAFFPDYTGMRAYMVKMTTEFKRVPEELKHYVPLMKDMTAFLKDSIKTIYVMVDEAHVKSGEHHRRSGLHMDGAWMEHQNGFPKIRTNGNSQTIVLSSTHTGSRGFIGLFCGRPKGGGDCSHFRMVNRMPCPFMGNKIYAINEVCLHESIPVYSDCDRQLIRINIADCPFPWK